MVHVSIVLNCTLLVYYYFSKSDLDRHFHGPCLIESGVKHH